MYSTLNRIFIPDLFNITAADEVVSIYTSDFTPSFEKKNYKVNGYRCCFKRSILFKPPISY
jgi:hypothetical protein